MKKKIIQIYNSEIKKNDMVLISDYGHGLFSSKISKILNKTKKFTSVNVQLNSANIGYHSLDKYKKADLLVLNERELRNEFRDKESQIKTLLIKTAKFKEFRLILVTRGGDGLILLNTKNKKFYECPAFANNIIDKTGSGDIIHAFFSLCVKANIDFELALFISSIAAAEKLKDYANKKVINKDYLIKIILHYLK